MLKDEKDHWVEKLQISKQLRDEMILEAVSRIHRKLAAAKDLLKTDTHNDIAAGLYTFAQEYGKM